jgi:hypothetical protein
MSYAHLGDASNRIKVCEDAISQALEINDMVFHAHHHVRRYDKTNPRVLVKIDVFRDEAEGEELYPCPVLGR